MKNEELGSCDITTDIKNVSMKNECKNIGKNRKPIKTSDEFIKEAKEIHGNKYDYSTINYINSNIKIKIICTVCNDEFEQLPSSHLRGIGCPKCAGVKRLTTSEFIKLSIKKHGNIYNYSNSVYVNNHTKLIIICAIHGEFKQRPSDHMGGNGCPYCVGKSKTTEMFITEANIFHNNTFDYSKTKYIGNKIPVIIICKQHGEFYQLPNSHLSGRGCPCCRSSKGELEIKHWLDTHNILYLREKTFDGLVGVGHKLLKYDFYIPVHNTLIEFDGAQHYDGKQVGKYKLTKSDFRRLKEHDKRKDEYVKINKIDLLRIPYYNIKKIPYILNKKLKL